jgi:outer membrane protein TolC
MRHSEMQEIKAYIENKSFINKSRNPSFYSKFLLISIFFNLFLYYSLFSQSDSLSSYLEIALKNNPVVAQKYYEYQAALQKIPQAGTLPDPELSAGIFLRPMELIGGKQITDLRLMQMFPWFGVLKYAKSEMNLMANAGFESYRDTRLQLYYDVQRTWYELYKVRKDAEISEKNIEILMSIENLATAKFQSASKPSSGSMSGLSDLYRIQIESGELQNDISGLIDQERTLVALFNSYLNRPPEVPVFTPAAIIPDTLSLSKITVADSIMKNNPVLNMLRYEEQSLDSKGKMAKMTGYPMVGLGINYSVIGKSDISTSAMNGKDMIMPMVSVSLPIYRKKYNALVSEAEMLKTATVSNYDAALNSLRTEYFQAVQSYHDARRRIRLFNIQFELTSRSFEIVLKSFAASDASLTDLLRVRQQTFDYELKQAEALADLNSAAALIKRLTASFEL